MENIAKKSNTEFILNTFNLKPSKKYGQNFLVDPGIIQSIADHASLDKETAVIEIGPGIGALTEQLSNKAGKVLCFEIDERLKEVLSFSLEGHDNVEIIFQDFMKADLEEACNKLKDYKDICVVTNLPYYITSKIITKIVSSSTPINRLVAMVQKEVALKLCSEEKSPLKMMIDYVGDVQYELNVPRHVFMPAPHVDSAVISIHKERVISQELIDEGNIGLIKAAERFDETRGVQIYLIRCMVDLSEYFTGNSRAKPNCSTSSQPGRITQ